MKDRDESMTARHVAVRMVDALHDENQRLIRWLRSIADGGHDAAAARKAIRALRGEPFPNPWHPSEAPYDHGGDAS